MLTFDRTLYTETTQAMKGEYQAMEKGKSANITCKYLRPLYRM